MAIAPTGGIYKTLTFDGVSSREFGVYITGEAVFNAPQREVEMISIPGRNGQFALDKGRFENIEVSYPAGIFADNETDFAEAISNFRNFLCSRHGYVQLTDDYNPNEYRMAVYISGLEVTPALLKAGEFTITFNCKPQRWLASGETAIEIESGDELINPTSFEAQPLLAVEGYGDIELGDYTVSLEDKSFGPLEIHSSGVFTGSSSSFSFKFDGNLVLDGDTIYMPGMTVRVMYGSRLSSVTLTGSDSRTGCTTTVSEYSSGTYRFQTTWAAFTTQFGQGSGIYNVYISNSIPIHYETTWGDSIDTTYVITITYRRDTNDFSISGQISDTVVGIGHSGYTVTLSDNITTVSTETLLGHPTYIDCDLGEAYKIVDGQIISLNAYIDLGSDLPILTAGANEITFDNTVTDLKVKPNWWKV